MNKIMLVLFAAVFAVFVLVSSVFAADNRWSNFKPGSWVLYELSGGMQQKQTLVAKTDTGMIIKNEVVIGGNVVSSNEMDLPLSAGDAAAINGLAVKISSAEFEVQGKKLQCKTFDSETPQGDSRTLFSDQVPGGLVQANLGGNVLMTAIDYEAK